MEPVKGKGIIDFRNCFMTIHENVRIRQIIHLSKIYKGISNRNKSYIECNALWNSVEKLKADTT